ncbi:hypothetical protein KCP78_10800 [Salmonella enterica subsp. enterica]|nr:hypothetical protein KCP78_10800 [Salmonella enterica subsp. enterica]
MVDTIYKQARRVASATRYPPLGQATRLARAWRVRRAGEESTTIWHWCANEPLCLLRRLKAAALENLDAILEAKGIDGVFIGPADLVSLLPIMPDTGSAAIIEARVFIVFAPPKAAVFGGRSAMAQKMFGVGREFLSRSG